jgi:hypothetical protein
MRTSARAARPRIRSRPSARPVYRQATDNLGAGVWVRQRPLDGCHRAVVAVAGPLAQAKYLDRDPDEVLYQSCGCVDLEIALDALETVTAPRPCIWEIAQRAERIVDAHWDTIETLANALVRRDKLGCDSADLSAMHNLV